MTDPSTDTTPDRLLKGFRAMVLARVAEDKVSSLYHAGKLVGGVYTGRGQEAFSAGLGVHLQKGLDIFGPLIRDQAGRLAFGEPLEDMARTYFGSAFGPMRGRDGNVHRGRPKEGLFAMISHLGTMTSVVAGALLARRLRGQSGHIGATTIGEGGTSTGSFHEALNLAAVEKLPLVVAVANNHYAYSTPTSRQFACANLVDRAAGYGVRGYTVDGTDLAACVEVFREAAAKARAGGGPQLVIGSLLRLSGHGEHDDSSYIDPELRKSKAGRDCMDVATAHVLEGGLMTTDDVDALHAEAARRVDTVLSQVQSEPAPDPFDETWRSLSHHHLGEGAVADDIPAPTHAGT